MEQNVIFVTVLLLQIIIIIRIYKMLNEVTWLRLLSLFMITLVITLFVNWVFHHELTTSLLAIAVTFIATVIVLHKSVPDTFFDFFVVYTITDLSQSVILIFHVFILPALTWMPQTLNKEKEVLFINLFLALFIMAITSIKRATFYVRQYRKAIQDYPVSLFLIILPLILLNIISIDLPVIVSERYLLIFLLLFWFFFILYFMVLKKSIETAAQKKEMEVYQQYYPLISNIIDETKRKQHEFKNHLNVVKELMNQYGEGDTTIQYIDGIACAINDGAFLLEIENKILGAFLYSKLKEAESYGILMKFCVEDVSLPLYDYELIEILGILLDNAFEELQNDKTVKNPEVILELNSKNNHSCITVKNNGPRISPEEIYNIFKPGYSTKGRERGYGLYHLKHIVKKAGGEIELFHQDGYTVFLVKCSSQTRPEK